MGHSNRGAARASTRAGRRDRHGRGIRASVTGPRLPLLHTRLTTFEATVAATAEYLKDLWPAELSGLRVEIGALPANDSDSVSASVSASAITSGRIRRWDAVPDEHLIILYRLPIQRLTRLHRNDDLHRRMLVESCVFRAVAELLGKDPWDLAPERFRHF